MPPPPAAAPLRLAPAANRRGAPWRICCGICLVAAITASSTSTEWSRLWRGQLRLPSADARAPANVRRRQTQTPATPTRTPTTPRSSPSSEPTARSSAASRVPTASRQSVGIPPPALVPTPYPMRPCGKWIYLVGDSSFRMLNAALVEHLNGTLEDWQFGSYKTFDKGGCVQEQDGHMGMGCTREFVDWRHRVRTTFTFKTMASQETEALNHLTTVSQFPDVFVLGTGAHDFYKGHSVHSTVKDTLKWVKSMLLRYPHSEFIFFTLVSCSEKYKTRARAFNLGIREAFSYSYAKNLRVHLIDREPSTVNVTDEALCEGWHAYGPVVRGHLESLLRALPFNATTSQRAAC